MLILCSNSANVFMSHLPMFMLASSCQEVLHYFSVAPPYELKLFSFRRLSCSPPCSKNPANIWEVFLSSSLTMSFWISDFIMALGFPSQDDSSVMEYTISGLILLISSIPFLPQLLLSYLSTLCPVHVSHCHVSVSGACTTVGSECLPDNAPTTIPSHPSVAGNDFTTFIFLHNT